MLEFVREAGGTLSVLKRKESSCGKAPGKFMTNTDSDVVRFLLVWVLACCLALASLAPSAAQNTTTGKSTAAPQISAPAASPQPATSPAQSAVQSSPNVNAVTQAAVQAGVLSCVSRINQVMTFLTANSSSAAFLFIPKSQPDQSVFSVSLAIKGQQTATKYASASFAPTTNGQAAAVYDTVEYVAQSPAEVRKSMFKDLKSKGNLGNDIVMLDGGAVMVFLMPAGSGCIVIKKEVIQ